MQWRSLFASVILVLVAAVWGTTYVYQRIANGILDPFIFTGVRFFIGAFTILPFYFLLQTRTKGSTKKGQVKNSLFYGAVIGLVLLFAIMFQQIGLFYTSAAKAGFISGMYVIFTPLVGVVLFREKKQSIVVYLCCLLAFSGLLALSLETTEFTINQGDIMLILSALFWAIQIVFISHSVHKVDVLLFASMQFLFCSFFCFFIAFFIGETLSLDALKAASYIIIFTGVISVGLCFSIQVFAQKFASSVSVAVIFSLESIFAALAEAIILNEFLTFSETVGCLLILSAILLMQLHTFQTNKKLKKT